MLDNSFTFSLTCLCHGIRIDGEYITVTIAHVLIIYSALQAKKNRQKTPSTLHQCQVYNEVKHKMKPYSGPHHLLLSSPASVFLLTCRL